ncbi:glycosyltransferase family 2 protein [Candidatus Woesearchaeota archaeon]|nr:MAG: glycosyltransferase family 2 protein [Candidatus Woesearchaeota archaeon]
MSKKNNVWAIMPAYNEEKRIGKVLESLLKKVENVVVVDDGSSDGTYEEAGNWPVHILRHPVNLGKGAALKTGCEYAVSQNADVLVFIDADGQHHPEEIDNLLREIKEGKDIVFGVRKFDKNMPAILKLGNKIISSVMRFLYRINIKDTQSGFRCMTRKAYERIRWKSTDYSVESEMIARAGKEGLKYGEVTIKTLYSDKYKGTTVIDGIKIVADLVWWRIKRI